MKSVRALFVGVGTCGRQGGVTMGKWCVVALAVVLVLITGRWASYYVGAVPFAHVPLASGNVDVPTVRTLAWDHRSPLTDHVLRYWENRPLGDWQTDGKVGAPRALMGRFLLHHDLEVANAYLQSVTPWGRAGSTWALHREGDYDFTMAGLVPILFLFGDRPDVLYPEARDHLVNVLLPLEGGDPLVKVPRTLGLVRDTENHLLMTEGSRYLKNRWLALHGSRLAKHDNVANGLEAWLLNLLEALRATGLYELNSIPYEGYTLTALLNLEAFGSDAVQLAARGLLDELNWKYALGSLDYRRFPPFRRRYSHAADTALNRDRHVGLIRTWMSLLPDMPSDPVLGANQHVALWACWSPYRLPDDTARWIAEKPRDYFVRMGHGPGGSPEIYSGGPGYLLTAGGVNRGRRSMIVARPITLLFEDGATDLSQALHLAGPGDNMRQWNNTGVSKNFAVAAGPVHVPGGWKPSAGGSPWKAYQRGPFCVAVYSCSGLGLVHVSRAEDPKAFLTRVEKANAEEERLARCFQVPAGDLIEYDTAAPEDRWVLTKINGRRVDRKFDRWPRMEEE